MTPTRRAVTMFAALGLTVALTACGGEDEPDPIPSTSETSEPGPEVSPAPDGPELDAEQQASFDAAVQRYADYQEFSNRVWQEPSRDPEVADELAEYTVMPETKAWSDSNEGLIQNGQHYSGSRKVEWSVPVKVTDDQVHFKQCESPGDYKLHEGDQVSEATDNIISEVYMVKRDDLWLIENQTFEEEC